MKEEKVPAQKDWTKTAKRMALHSYGRKGVKRMEIERHINKMSQVFWED